MSDEERPSMAIRIIQQEHLKAVDDQSAALRKRRDAQRLVEDAAEKAEELENFLADHGERPDEEVPRILENIDRMELQHAVKFVNRTAPSTITPARAITLTITHPDCNSDRRGKEFSKKLALALHEFAEYQADVEDRSTANPPPEPRYPFKASNGCMVEVLPHVQVNPPPEPSGTRLDPKTFLPLE